MDAVSFKVCSLEVILFYEKDPSTAESFNKVAKVETLSFPEKRCLSEPGELRIDLPRQRIHIIRTISFRI